MNPNSLLWKYWFAVLRSPADGEGGGAGDGASGTEAGAGAGEGAAGDPPAPAAAPIEPENRSFLSGAAKALAEPKLDANGKPIVPAEGEAKTEGEAPAAFDLAAITLPEGVELDPEVGKSFSDILSNTELSPQERGQQLMDLHTSALKATFESAVESVKAANLETFTKMNADWRKEIPNLPEFKDNPDAEGGKVMQALLSIGLGQPFFDALDLTGAGNHPEILRGLHRLTKPLMEGGAVTGAGATSPKKEPGTNIYTSTRT